MKSNVNFLVAEKEWIPLIGKFIVDFASIEDSLHQVVKYHVRNTAIKHEWFAEKFNEQLEIFKSVMEKEILIDEVEIKNLHNLIAKIKKLKNTRNLIAHNSLSLLFEENDIGEMKAIEFAIDGKRSRSSINFDMLVNDSKKLHHCRTLLSKFMLKFHENEIRHIQDHNEGIAKLTAKR